MKKIKVAIGMSGGVDSSVVAKILLDQGYEVVGFMMKLWSGSDTKCTRDNACCDIDGLQDAKRVAKILNIPFYVIDVREKFKKEVADYFIEEYKNLRTPNPCVKCNEKIKFGWLLDFAEKTGCDFLATGHYARIAKYVISSDGEKSHVQKDLSPCSTHLAGGLAMGRDDRTECRLLKGMDENKDQSYFLYRLNQKQLAKIMFPVGEFTKTEVRAMAKKWHLPVHEKKESQEICFVEEKDYREFLRKNISADFFNSGDIVDLSGNVIGKHDGLINYTIGQRRGIAQVSSIKYQVSSNDKQPLYVIGFNVAKNQLIVGEDKDIFKDEMIVGDLSWINNDSEFRIQPCLPAGRNSAELKVKIRYRHPAVNCKILPARHPEFISGSQKDGMLKRMQIPKRVRDDASASVWHDKMLTVNFQEKQRAITPGQSAVFYDGDEVLGGGVII